MLGIQVTSLEVEEKEGGGEVVIEGILTSTGICTSATSVSFIVSAHTVGKNVSHTYFLLF